MSQTNNSCGGGKASCFLIIMGVIFLLAGMGSDSPAPSLFGWAAIGLAAVLYYNQRNSTLRRKNEEVLSSLLAQRKQEAVEEQVREEQEFQALPRDVDQLITLLERQQAGKVEREQAREPDAEQIQILQQLSSGWPDALGAEQTVSSEPIEADTALTFKQDPEPFAPVDPTTALPESKPVPVPSQAEAAPKSRFSSPVPPVIAAVPPVQQTLSATQAKGLPAVVSAKGKRDALRAAESLASRFAQAIGAPQQVSHASQPAPTKATQDVPSTESVRQTEFTPAPTLPDEQASKSKSSGPDAQHVPLKSSGEGGFSYTPTLVSSRFSTQPDADKKTTPPAEG